MKDENSTLIDRNVAYFFPHDRPYSDAEALLSYAIDLDNSKSGTINGYAKQWSWGRKKVRKFIFDITSPDGHQRNRKGTHEAQAITLKNGSLRKRRNTKGTPKEQVKDNTHEQIIDHLNHKLGAKYKSSSAKTRQFINARLNEGHTVAEFLAVIDKMTGEWGNTDMAKYLRPETLFGTKFEGYLNQKVGGRKVSANEQRLIDKGWVK